MAEAPVKQAPKAKATGVNKDGFEKGGAVNEADYALHMARLRQAKNAKK